MKNRIATGWTLQRVCYLAAGIFLAVRGISQQQWPGIAFGGYLFLVGLSGWGCGEGSHWGISGETAPASGSDVVFKEIETK